MIWYYEFNCQIAGPVSEAELMDGRIGGATLVWTEGMQGWLAAQAVWPYRWSVVAMPAPMVQPVGPTSGPEVPVENLYAPPQSAFTSPPDDDFTADGLYQNQGDLICPVKAELPHCCIKCGDVVAPVRKQLHLDWTKSDPTKVVFFLVLGVVGLLLYVLQKRNTAQLNVSLCLEHDEAWRRRTRNCYLAFAIGAGAAVMAWYGGSFDYLIRSGCIVVSVGSIIAGVLIGLRNKGPLEPTEIGRSMGRFSGAAPELLARLPKWTQAID